MGSDKEDEKDISDFCGGGRADKHACGGYLK